MEIQLKSLRGEEMMLEVDPKDTIARIKELVEEIWDIPRIKQIFICRSRILVDHKTLHDHNIQAGSFFHVLIKRKVPDTRETMEIKVKTLQGKEMVIEIDSTDTIVRIKEKVKEICGIDPIRQRLLYNGKQLVDDHATAQHYNIENGSLLHLVLKLDKERKKAMKIKVKTLERQEMWIEIDSTDRIGWIKLRLKEICGIAPIGQRLLYNGEELVDHETAQHYNIESGSLLYLIRKLDKKERKQTVKIKVETTQGQEMVIEMDPTDTIADIKERVKETLGIAPIHKRIACKGKEFFDHEKLQDCNFHDGSVLIVIVLGMFC